MKAWIAFWNILKKDMRNYYLKPPNISWGIIFPVAWTLMVFLKSGTSLDIRGLLPGVMCLSILFGTTSMLAVTITFERKSRSFERLLIAPIDLSLLMLAKTTGAIVFGIFNGFVPVIFALFMTDLSGINWLLVLGGVFLIAVTSTFLGLFIAVSVSEVFEAQTFSNFFRFPMIFLCGLFIPVQVLPVFLRPISYSMPLTYGADILNAVISDRGHIGLLMSFLILIGFSIVLFSVSTRNVKRKWIY
ncbi:MAG: ABC transporter permease [Desulfobacteraceae bacterium]|nr:MAG: ABC transporter permease [Desulfobacteraceae bacterium]